MGHHRDPTPFLCTFCWTLQHPPSRPKSLGAEKRICCQGCYEQLLDLAICWVCGEIVVREDEVVSLGWCFWHRGCFGCLLCGQPVDLRFDELDEDLGYGRGRHGQFVYNKTGNKMKDEIEEVRQSRKRKAMAVELDEVPVCNACNSMLVETGAHREEVGMFLGRSNVSQHDSGLGEARWKKLRRTHTDTDVSRTPRAQSPSPSTARTMTRLFKSPEIGYNSGVRSLEPLTSFMNVYAEKAQSSNKTVRPARRRGRRRATEGHSGAFVSDYSVISTMGRDGSSDSLHFDANEIEAMFPRIPRPPPVKTRPLTPPPEVSPIYVSITDPINSPSFRPSPTKPIPRWMALLPGRRPGQRTTVSSPRSQNRSREQSLVSQIAPSKPFDWSAYRRSLHGSLDSDIEEAIATPPPPAPLPSPSEHHPAPDTVNSPANSLPTVPESPRTTSDSRRFAHTQGMTSETVYFTPPDFPCDFFRQAMEKRGVHDEDSLRRVTKSMKEGSLQAGHSRFHKRTRSEASACLAEIISPPGATPENEISLPVGSPDAMKLHGRIRSEVTSSRPKAASNAEFIERYNLPVEEEDRRSKERARSVRGSLERIRGRGSVMRMVSHAPPKEMKEESETGQSEEGELTEETGQERLRKELKGILMRPT